MMRYLLISWLLFLCPETALARDPFAPQQQASCLSSVASPERWQLQGMIGRGNRFLGWLRSAQGERLAIASNQPLPFADWQIDAFTPFRLTLSAPQSCVPQRVTLHIKGSYHDKDHRRAVVDERSSAGPP